MRLPAPGTCRRRLALVALCVLGVLAAVSGPVRADEAAPLPGGDATAGDVPSLGMVDAVVLGVIEGITEFLPISSTGHLLIAGRLLDLDRTDAAKDAFDAYAIAIQAGAILAVLGLYRQRIGRMVAGLAGRDPAGRNLALCLVVAFVPAAVIGVVLEGPIKDRLFQPWAIAVAWAVGGAVILGWERRCRMASASVPAAEVRSVAARTTTGLSLDQLTLKMALVVGVAQAFALWPGTSRSLVTILAALAIGLELAAAVELSFLLGLLTLGAATAYEGVRNAGTMVDAYGVGTPLIGLAAALVSAVLAVRWMVGWLQSRGLEVFGWYRLGAAGLTVVLLATGALAR